MTKPLPEPSRELTCRDLIEFLDDYVADRQPPELRVAFESHLAECRHCRDYLRTYSDTIAVARASLCDESRAGALPEDLVQAIVDSVRRHS
ncbi:MAG: zf-HC2 domain-containing protein [Phycisphaerae bacterium]|nr:zf-HC2 domain-containing protein [Phycisphaerae bacterium]